MKPYIIIPAFNEESTIKNVIQEAKLYVNNILVVDDFSDDNTALIAKDSGAKVLKLNQNKGYDNAIEIGMKYALQQGASSILTIDADGQHPLEFIPEMIELVENNQIDLVIGIRNGLPRLSEKIFSFFTYRIYDIEDITCGMKCYSKLICLKYGFGSKYKSVGTYLSVKAIKMSHSFQKKYITIHPRVNSSRFGMNIKSEFLIFKAFLYSFFY